MLLQLIMLFLQLVSLLIITCDAPVFYVKYCRKRKYLSEVNAINKNSKLEWNIFFIWSEIKYDINSKISFKNICTFEKKHES